MLKNCRPIAFIITKLFVIITNRLIDCCYLSLRHIHRLKLRLFPRILPWHDHTSHLTRCACTWLWLLDRCSPVGATPFQSPQWLSVAELSGFRQSLIFPVMIQKPFTSRHLIMTAVCQCSVLSVICEGNPSDKICKETYFFSCNTAWEVYLHETCAENLRMPDGWCPDDAFWTPACSCILVTAGWRSPVRMWIRHAATATP
jgi:hypothetical protein